MQFFSCVCSIASIFIREARHATHLISLVSDAVFYTTLGLLASQVDYELKFRNPTTKDQYEAIPVDEDNFIAKGIPVKNEYYES